MIHRNTINKAKRVQELARRYYQPERHDTCWSEVFRRYVYPVYPMAYSSFKRLMAIDVDKESKCCAPAKHRMPVLFPNELFRDEDF